MIVCDGASGEGLNINGKKYYFAEATDDSSTWYNREIGSKPNGFKSWSELNYYKYYLV